MTIFHIDVNSAYLSWTAVQMLREGYEIDIRNIPACIGGDPKSRHGIILAKSIPAGRKGVSTGESLMEARKKCPDIKVFPPDYNLYMQNSNDLFELLSEYSPKIQRYSVDECFLDFTASEKLMGGPIEVANKIRERIKEELGFTVNIGVSTNKLLAKMAGELEKPDKVHGIFPSEVEEKLWPMPVGELFMVGRASVRKLAKMNITTVGDLAKADVGQLRAMLK
ncbi:MAG: DNA polymerase Y family protein, partial [Anaerovoracaceae bacterium]